MNSKYKLRATANNNNTLLYLLGIKHKSNAKLLTAYYLPFSAGTSLFKSTTEAPEQCAKFVQS